MSNDIHASAIIADGAEINENVSIGPWCTIGPKVRLGAGVRLISHVCIEGATEIGEGTLIYPHTALGYPPQDFNYDGEETRLIIGKNCTLREHVTMHTGTIAGRGETRVGDGGYFMVGSHVAHDCVVGDNVWFANNGTLGGGVVLGDCVILGGLSAIHQNGRIGRHAFIGAAALVTTDVIPYATVVGNRGRLEGLNVVGLKRRGFKRKTVHDIRAAYRLLFADEGTFQERIEDVALLFSECPEVMEIIEFVRAPASRPLCTP